MIDYGYRYSLPPKGGDRGRVLGFSRASRLRLMQWVATCQNKPQYFVTLTYPAEFPSDLDSKAQLKRFFQTWQRECRKAGIRTCVLWRMEWQKRGAPHYHMLLWLPPELTVLPIDFRGTRGWRRFVEAWATSPAKAALAGPAYPDIWEGILGAFSCIWHAIVEDGAEAHLQAGVDLQRIQNDGHLVSYVSKYVAKVEPVDEYTEVHKVIERTGRIWGIRGDRELPDRTPIAVVDFADIAHADRVLGELWRSEGLRYATACHDKKQHKYSVFAPRPDALVQTALDLSDMDLTEPNMAH